MSGYCEQCGNTICICDEVAKAPKREWVGLTEEEAAACWSTSAVQTWKNFEAKLKEKNT